MKMIIGWSFLTHSAENSTRTVYWIFYLINFILFFNYMFILNFLPATFFKPVGRGTTKDWDSCEKLKETLLFGSFHGYRMMGSWLGMKGFSLSQARMGRGSPVHESYGYVSSLNCFLQMIYISHSVPTLSGIEAVSGLHYINSWNYYNNRCSLE